MGLWEPCEVPGIEPRSAICKVSVLLTSPYFSFFQLN